MKILCRLLLILCFPLLAMANNDALYYQHRINLPTVQPELKLAYIDSLMAMKKGNRDSLLVKKVEIAYDMGNFVTAADAYDDLMSKSKIKLPLNKQLQLQLYYIHGLHSKRLFYECIVQCMKMLRWDKPDSLRYYDAMVDCLLVDFNKQNSVSLTEEYVEKNKKLLKEAIDNKWPEASIQKLKFAYYTILMKNGIQKEHFDDALKYTDSIASLPITPNQRDALSINVAYLYMRLGKFDVAEQCFKDILASDMPSQRKAVALLNYTYLFNLQDKCRETIEIIDRYRDAGISLNNDLYGSYLLANKAIAQNYLGDYAGAYNTLMASKLLADSIYNKAGFQDGLLMLFDQTAKAKEMEKIESKLSRSYLWLGITVFLALSAVLFLLIMVSKLKKSKRATESVKNDLEQVKKQCDEVERQYAAMIQEESGKIAARLLPEAHLDDTFKALQEIMKEKGVGATDKLRQIEMLLNSPNTQIGGREMFEHHFEQAHAQFFRRLYAAHPSLTPVEVRMCGYLVMNLTNKEIAEITNKSVRSVESTRYRISKKMDLPEGESILTYLRNFLQD